jgi:hypothetical protein
LSSITKAPWQVGLAVAAAFVAAADYLGQALAHITLMAESDGLEHDRQAAIAHMTHNHDYDSVLGVQHFDDLSSRVFILVGVVILILGVFLWVGAFRGGVRGVLTVTLAVSFLGGLYPLFLSFDPASGLDAAGLVEAEFVNLVALIFALLLWGGAGRKWVALGAKKKWDQE